jgi:hypothetical protein
VFRPVVLGVNGTTMRLCGLFSWWKRRWVPACAGTTSVKTRAQKKAAGISASRLNRTDFKNQNV